ncbi:MAG: alpha/beta hydrolase [Microthrixaceae bacterium]
MQDEITAEISPENSSPVARLTGSSEVALGRELGWAEFGHPDGDVVFWFHGTPGARFQVPPRIGEVALQRGFRVIAVERPGTGRSSNHRYERIIDFASDFEALADALGVERFAVVGLSGGGPYTLAVAQHMPERVVLAALLGGFGPVRGSDAVFSYTRLLRFMATPLEVLRSPIGGLLNKVVSVATPVADPVFSLYTRFLGFADRPILGNPQFKAMFLHDLITAGELRATAHDLALFARHWGFQLADVTVPVVVWQGLSDVIVPPSHGHHQAARLGNAELRVLAGAGHFAGFSDAVQVLDRIRQIWAEQTAEPVASSGSGPMRAQDPTDPLPD